jgi:hypothetical protein
MNPITHDTTVTITPRDPIGIDIPPDGDSVDLVIATPHGPVLRLHFDDDDTLMRLSNRAIKARHDRACEHLLAQQLSETVSTTNDTNQ